MANDDSPRSSPDTEARLRELGLTEADLHEVLRLAELEAASCTEFDPPGNEGHVRWATGTRFFRLRYCRDGWCATNVSGGLAATVHPDGKHQVVVAMGDAATGDPLAMPRTKNPRGPATQTAISENVAQLDLFAASGVTVAEKGPDGTVTRFLLVHRSGNQVRAELSIPDRMGDHGKVSRFSDRIILSPLELDPTPSGVRRFDDGDDDFEVPVKRRAE